MELQGKIKLINDIQTFDSGFQKREFVVTTNEQYPQDIKMELIKDKCSLIDSYQVGDQVSVQFNLRGNEYNGRYYVNVQAWRIESGAEANTPPIPDSLPDMPPPSSGDNESDDLPF